MHTVTAQNVGVGTDSAVEKLEVTGNTKANGFFMNGTAQVYDFLIQLSQSGEVGYRKGHGGLGINFIICVVGVYPAGNAPTATTSEASFLGDIKILAGNVIPKGWRLCNGDLLSVNTNQALFSILGNLYGGTYPTNFALPDLRGKTLVGAGANPAGYNWTRAQQSQ